jgi:hypothetical protein
MFAWFTNLFRREQWRLVATVSDPDEYAHYTVNRIGERKDRGRFSFFYHLFESDRGNRRVEIAHTLTTASRNYDATKTAKNSEFYHTKIYRWEQGRYDPDIPRYSEVPEEDTANALKGTL